MEKSLLKCREAKINKTVKISSLKLSSRNIVKRYWSRVLAELTNLNQAGFDERNSNLQAVLEYWRFKWLFKDFEIKKARVKIASIPKRLIR